MKKRDKIWLVKVLNKNWIISCRLKKLEGGLLRGILNLNLRVSITHSLISMFQNPEKILKFSGRNLLDLE